MLYNAFLKRNRTLGQASALAYQNFFGARSSNSGEEREITQVSSKLALPFGHSNCALIAQEYNFNKRF